MDYWCLRSAPTEGRVQYFRHFSEQRQTAHWTSNRSKAKHFRSREALLFVVNPLWPMRRRRVLELKLVHVVAKKEKT